MKKRDDKIATYNMRLAFYDIIIVIFLSICWLVTKPRIIIFSISNLNLHDNVRGVIVRATVRRLPRSAFVEAKISLPG